MDTSKGSARNRVVAAAGVAFLVFASVALSAGVSHAQDAGINMKVQPALFEQTINPGDQFSTAITVTNSGKTTQQFVVGVKDISGVNNGGQPIFTTSTITDYSVSSWVTLGKTAITVPAGGSVTVPFTITVPKNAQPGGHYGAIFVSYGATRPSANGSGLGYDVGALIEMRIAGDAKQLAEIKEFSTDRSLYQSPAVAFTASVANEGNVLIQPRGPIDITNMFGQKVGTVILNEQGAAVFPGAQRSFTATWGGSGFMFGQFTAVTTLNYGDTENKTVSASTAFWVIPIIPIAVVLGSIIFFVLIFVWAVRKYIRKRVNAMIGSGAQERSSVSEEEKLLSGGGLPISRLVFIVIATAIFALVFLLILLFFFG